MSEIISGYLQRKQVVQLLKQKIEDLSRIPVSSGDNQGYELGRRLGYVDALKDCVTLIKELPDEPKPKGRYVAGDPRTAQYRNQ